MGYPLINGDAPVPSQDTTNNVNMRDAIGNKTDTAVETSGTVNSIMGYTKGLVNSRITDKEKSIGGFKGETGFSEYFSNLTNGADPSSTYWTVVEENDGAVDLTIGTFTYMGLEAGSVAGNNSIIHTKEKYYMNFSDDFVNSLHFRTIATVPDFGGEGSIGLSHYADADGDCTTFDNTSIATGANIYWDNDIIYARSGDGVSVEATNITAYFPVSGIQFELEIVLENGTTTFYVNGTARATHTTTPVTERTLYINASVINANTVASKLNPRFIEVWGE